MKNLQLNVEIVPSHVDETVTEPLSPDAYVSLLASRKALEVARKYQNYAHKHRDLPCNAIVIGADTVVVENGDILGKPKDADDAAVMLRRLQGKTHQVYTGICLVQTGQDNPLLVRHACTKVTMRRMHDEDIRLYVATGEPLDKAGSYGIQGLGSVFITNIDGDYFNVVGLPLALLFDMLRTVGFDVLRACAHGRCQTSEPGSTL